MTEFPMCGHPQWMGKAEPCRTVGTCPEHEYTCPYCGFGKGQAPACRCNDNLNMFEGYEASASMQLQILKEFENVDRENF